jgi:hypothetical protein
MEWYLGLAAVGVLAVVFWGAEVFHPKAPERVREDWRAMLEDIQRQDAAYEVQAWLLALLAVSVVLASLFY